MPKEMAFLKKKKRETPIFHDSRDSRQGQDTGHPLASLQGKGVWRGGDNSPREQDNGFKKEKICKQHFIAVTECIRTLCLCYCTLCVNLSPSIISFLFFRVCGRIMTSFTSFFFYYFLSSYTR